MYTVVKKNYSYCYRYTDAGSGVLLLASILHCNLYKYK
jgi:hypothetical protein